MARVPVRVPHRRGAARWRALHLHRRLRHRVRARRTPEAPVPPAPSGARAQAGHGGTQPAGLAAHLRRGGAQALDASRARLRGALAHGASTGACPSPTAVAGAAEMGHTRRFRALRIFCPRPGRSPSNLPSSRIVGSEGATLACRWRGLRTRPSRNLCASARFRDCALAERAAAAGATFFPRFSAPPPPPPPLFFLLLVPCRFSHLSLSSLGRSPRFVS
mmetsp:Transcript_23229/g.75238  ORF Transcript_23229/g.75238 Transcript_23229/m.75238 type:complete len:219 (-) Transcript_23229:276-932(-)